MGCGLWVVSRRLETVDCSTGPGNDRGLLQSGSRPGQPGWRDSPPWTCSHVSTWSVLLTSHFSLLPSQAPARSSHPGPTSLYSSPESRRANERACGTDLASAAVATGHTMLLKYCINQVHIKHVGCSYDVTVHWQRRPALSVRTRLCLPAASSQCLARVRRTRSLMMVDPRRGPTCRS